MSWNIRKTKKYGITPLLKDCDKIHLLEWQEYVDGDKELMWAEESPIADGFKKAGHEWIEKENYRKQAYFDFNKKKNWAGLRFSFFNGTILVYTERQTLKRVEKMWDVAQYFDAYLFKNGIRFTLKKLEKLREQYRAKKEGRRAPKEKE